MRWEKSVPSNLFQIVGIPVIGVTDKHLTVFGIDSGIDLLSKHVRKKFPSYHCFQAQCIYYITVAVCSYEYGTEKMLSLSNIQLISILQQ